MLIVLQSKRKEGAFIMKKLIALVILFTFIFSGMEVLAQEKPDFDPASPCGLSEKELSMGLLGELSYYSGEFIAAEKKYGVNAVFLAAVAALESGWGRYCFRQNNIFGWSGKDFESKEECIDFVASKLKEHYLSEGGKYYNGKTIEGINVCYNGNDFWAEKIKEIMSMIKKGADMNKNYALNSAKISS